MSTDRLVALVTGAGRGIGAATVQRLAADGYTVIALDSCEGPVATPYPLATPAELDRLREHGDVETVVADVRDRAGLADIVADVVRQHGRLDVVVAAAAIVAGGRPLWATPVDELDLLWDVDLKGVWHTASAAIPAMLAGPDPARTRFVAIASAAGSNGLYHLSAYTIVKHAVVGLIRGLAADLVATGAAAIAVSPGSTRTQMLAETAALYEDADENALASHQLLRRPLEPAEIAAVIAMCCSAEGAALNGSVVHADGGFGG